MRILALDSSGLVATVAIVEEEQILAEYTVNYKKTHSQTLLPMLDEIVKMTEFDLNTLDAIAVAGGPGSFTGLRIGSATAKVLLEISKRYFGSKEKQLIRKMQQEYDTLINTLNEEAKKVIAEIDAYFAKLGGLIEAALSKEAAVAFYGSVDLCRFLNINEDMVIHNKQELDVFMSN